jgi:hypothetical protein
VAHPAAFAHLLVLTRAPASTRLSFAEQLRDRGYRLW